MKRSRQVIQMRSYALAFAVVLSPVLLQFYSCDRGDTYLLKLELVVDGQDQIQGFNANNRSYAATVYSSTAILRVKTRMITSTASYQWMVGGTTIESGDVLPDDPNDPVDWTGTVMVNVPVGESVLRINVRSTEGAVEGYTVDVSTCPDGASCPFEGETGLCFDGICRSGQCDGVEFFQGCGEPMTGGWEGACVSNLCVSAAPVDECVKAGIGRVNCCTQQGCIDGYAAGCAEYSLDGTSCDPSNVEPPGGQGQAGMCDRGACVANIGSGYGLCEGIWCDPPTGAAVCKRNDCDPSNGLCAEWDVSGYPSCGGGAVVCWPGGACLIGADCTTDCTDTNPCTNDFCDLSTSVNGMCGPSQCCVHVPRQPGSVCGVTPTGQVEYCNDRAECHPGTVGNEISMGCTDSLDPAIKLMPFELLITPEGDRVPAGDLNSMTLGGTVFLTEEYLDQLQTAVPGGVDKIDVRELQATAIIRSGAYGGDVALVSEAIPTTCTVGDSVACDPANDLAGGAGNTDCVPTSASNPCGRFASIPTSTDCDPGGLCSTIDDWRNTKQTQCANNDFCVTDRLGLGLQDQLGNYQPYRSGLIKLGWDDRTTGATVQSGGPNDGTWILPPAEYANPVGSNGLRLGLVNSATAQVTDVAIECTMGVDSQGPYGVYSQDPLSSPTPSYDSTDYTRYHDELLSTLQIFPTGHFGGTGSLEVCLYIDPAEGTSLTPSHLCDLDDTGLSHSFQIRYDHASCSVPLAIDSTDTLPINPDGSFGLDPLLPTGFSGGLEGGDEDPYFLFYATGSAWSDAANCSTSWTAQPQPTDLPDGLPCDPTNTPCTLDCSTTSCFQHCTGDGVDCQMSCPFGVCLQQCGSGATCDMSCAGGDCTTICDPGATCNAQCGADCTLVCGSVVCPAPPQCHANQCDPGTGACMTTPVADLVACDVGDPVPGYCASGQCTTDYEGYVEALGDGRFRSVLLSGGGACCYDTPYEAGITYPNLYVDPALCDSYIENDSGGGLRLDYVGGGGACCYATVPELLAAWPNREICDGRPAF